MLLCDYLINFRDKLQPLRRDEPITRELAAMTEDRRRLVDQRTALCNELKAVLKRYFPTILELKAAKIYADFILALLVKYPTLADAQRAGKAKLLKLLFGMGTKDKIEERVNTLLNAIPLTEDATILRIESTRAVTICELLMAYNREIAKYDKALKELVVQHSDFNIFKSLPAGSFATQGRLIAAMGDDRSRYKNAEALQAASGIAPLTTQSGKQRFVSSRWACSKFMRQTFHEFAGLTIRKCPWAEAYYRLQLSRKKSPQMALRALAYKWQRILYRCWQSRTPYDDQRYVERLKATGSPLVALMSEQKTVEKKSKSSKTKNKKTA
jgi:transposase